MCTIWNETLYTLYGRSICDKSIFLLRLILMALIFMALILISLILIVALWEVFRLRLEDTPLSIALLAEDVDGDALTFSASRCGSDHPCAGQ